MNFEIASSVEMTKYFDVFLETLSKLGSLRILLALNDLKNEIQTTR